MAVFPLHYFTKPNVPVAFNDRYGSSPLGIKFAGQPKGVYVGLVPSVIGSVLTLSPDPTHGYSLVKVPSENDPGGMDVFLEDPVVLDFTGQPDVDYPILVIARASYTNDSSQPTEASFITRSGPTSSVADDEVLVCVVNGPTAAISVGNEPALGQKDVPLALSGVNFGYMPGGSIENLQAAADIVDEVVAARTGLNSTTHPSLSARLASDYGATSMAERLALSFRALRSNDYDMLIGESSVVVSGSFSEAERDHLPKITLDGSGSETTSGAIAAPADAIRNVAIAVDASTGCRLIDNTTDRRIIFGRISGPNTEVISGTWAFVNASTTLISSDGNGQATVELEVGDTVQGPDSKHYEVSAISSDTAVTLRTAYQGASSTAAIVTRRRWLLLLKKIVGGTEQDAALSADTSVRFFFPTFLPMATSTADWKLGLHTSAERPPLPLASTTVPGRVRLAAPGTLLGSINVQNAGAPLGGGPFHTINFNSVNASVVPTGTPGEVEVTEIGPQGPQGPDGPSGGPGNPGGPGPGFSALNAFEVSTEFVSNMLGVPVPFSFTQDMGHNIRVLHGNIAKWRDLGAFFGVGQERLVISDVSVVSATEGRIQGTIAGDTRLTVFLSSAGD